MATLLLTQRFTEANSFTSQQHNKNNGATYTVIQKNAGIYI